MQLTRIVDVARRLSRTIDAIGHGACCHSAAWLLIRPSAGVRAATSGKLEDVRL